MLDLAIGGVGLVHHQRKHHVLERGQAAEQALLLEQERNVVPDAVEVAAPPLVQRSSLDPYLAGGRPQLAVQQTQQRGLPRSAGTRHLDQLARRDREVELVDHDALAEQLSDRAELDQRSRRRLRFPL